MPKILFTLLTNLRNVGYMEEVRKNGRGLTHQDVEVLQLEIMTSTKGELIAAVLEKVTNKMGTPRQIVSDHGSDTNLI